MRVAGRRRFRHSAAVVVTAAALAAGGGVAVAAVHAASSGLRARSPGVGDVLPAATPAGAARARRTSTTRSGASTQQSSVAGGPAEFTTTADPTSLDPPVQTPPTRPVTVTIADHASFGNGPPPATSEVTLPEGRWAQVDLVVTGSETGRQYDRLCEIFDGQSQIFLGVTPEPTPAGIHWRTEKDVTGYLPILSGSQTFSTYVDNYLSSVDTGIPVITAELLFYPAGGGFAPARAATPAAPALAGTAMNQDGPASSVRRAGVPSSVVPLTPPGAANTFNTINPAASQSVTVTVPADADTATLDLYAVGQANDEFWFGLQPGFREIEVRVDGKPAGVVWPFPFVYTGGVNPLIWRPVTGLHTLDIPSYRLDLTPFIGAMSGRATTVSLTVANNDSYWLAGGSLLLGRGGGPTSGSLLSDTLSLPTTSQTTTTDALGSSDQPVTSESASASYTLAGTVRSGNHSWTDTVDERMQFGDDQTNIDPSCSGASCYQWVHAEETQTETRTVTGSGADVHRQDRSTWTVDAPNGYLTADDAFVLPASVSQELTDVATETGGRAAAWSRLTEAVIGYGDLGEDGAATTIANAETTGTVTASSSAGQAYQRTVVARGGVVEQDLVTP